MMKNCFSHNTNWLRSNINIDYRILFIQFGDFEKAIFDLETNDGETYYSQRYSVEWVKKLAQFVDSILVICLSKDYSNRPCHKKITTTGINYWGNKLNKKILIEEIKKFNPTHIILTTPLDPVISYSIKNKIKIFPIFADSFFKKKLSPRKTIIRDFYKFIRIQRLSYLLQQKEIKWVANHNIPSCISLHSIGIDLQKIIPWDWPEHSNLHKYPPKKLPTAKRYEIIYIGSIREEKGVGDLLSAINILLNNKRCPFNLKLHLIGQGNLSMFSEMVSSLRIKDFVQFHGVVNNSKIIPLINSKDLIIVPSRNDYPEGLPITIYESFVAKTPLIVSTHRMFTSLLSNKKNVVFFQERDAFDLAKKIFQLLTNKDLYATLSNNSTISYKRISCKAKWADVIAAILSGSEESENWLTSHCLVNELRKKQISLQ